MDKYQNPNTIILYQRNGLNIFGNNFRVLSIDNFKISDLIKKFAKFHWLLYKKLPSEGAKSPGKRSKKSYFFWIISFSFTIFRETGFGSKIILGLVENVNNCSQKNVTMSIKSKM
ncbi:hypothetical protein BpHYR1_052919 [Brachionus plicatilis]|uniref:Uncharacterized protein n=1 Tax=Brachionus plicatilis TaxID=10195 RepID=A0A3M7S9R6_BRAPC|nr:hypothetical protein BpHYR1_052919 [Brachionus plicatilis]